MGVETRAQEKRKRSIDDQPSSSSLTGDDVKEEPPTKREKTKEDINDDTSNKSNIQEEEKKSVYDYPNEENSDMENGHIYFLFRPKIDVEDPESIQDVQHTYIILKPSFTKATKHPEKRQPTMIIVGAKKLPSAKRHDRYWGFVAASSKDMNGLVNDFKESTHYTKTRGERTVPAARILGEGVYSISKRGRNSYLAYILKTPDEPTQVQNAFHLEKEASMIFTIKNPTKPPKTSTSETATQTSDQKQPNFPSWLQEEFNDKRFIGMTETTLFLNYPSTQVILIGARHSIDKDELGEDTVDALSELSEEEDQDTETKSNKRILDQLHLRTKDIPMEPLEGEW